MRNRWRIAPIDTAGELRGNRQEDDETARASAYRPPLRGRGDWFRTSRARPTDRAGGVIITGDALAFGIEHVSQVPVRDQNDWTGVGWKREPQSTCSSVPTSM